MTDSPITLTLITTCKGRLAQLRETLPSFVRQEFRPRVASPPVSYELLVVDYGCPDGTYECVWDYVQDHRQQNRLQEGKPFFRCLQIQDNVDYFNLSRARNIGGRAARGRFLVFVDCDILLPADFLQRGLDTLEMSQRLHACGACAGEPIDLGDRYTFPCQNLGDPAKAPVASNGGGAFQVGEFIHASGFRAVRGYDEEFEGHGYEDVDFRLRLLAAGYRDWWFDSGATLLKYHAAEQVKHYPPHLQDTAVSQARNRARMENAKRHVNPFGYGVHVAPTPSVSAPVPV